MRCQPPNITVTSGWGVDDASPIFKSICFPPAITLHGCLGDALLWHFPAIGLLVANFFAHLGLSVVAAHFTQKLLRVTAPKYRLQVGRW